MVMAYVLGVRMLDACLFVVLASLRSLCASRFAMTLRSRFALRVSRSFRSFVRACSRSFAVRALLPFVRGERGRERQGESRRCLLAGEEGRERKARSMLF